MAVGARSRRAEIARMTLRDLDGVMEIERAAFKAPWSRQVFIEELERDWAHIDVLRERAGSPVRAFANYWLVRDEVHLLNVATHPDTRRRGLASVLLGHVIDFAWDAGCRYITLEARRSNQGAIRLYRKFGFRPVGIRPNYYVEDQEDAIVMLLDRLRGKG
ncbi:MAG: ribosomal-protein-alanine N-acetyltransferase [Myxococcales bacterium]|nr:ribosomal-protein-alanine N-acetyltransferase [Myxococcales bacterium]